MEHTLKNSGLIGLGAMSAAYLAQSFDIKDWKAVSACASVGCFLLGKYVQKGH